MKRLAIGILAHVDSGKTTLSEAMLYRGGQLRKLGRVDHKDAFLDTHDLERQRGITIFSKQAMLRLDDVELTLLDTPGHVDFSAEMERTLQVMDYAILVISGTDGVQSHTETLWRLLKRYQIPVFLFINKMDLAGADHSRILQELKQRLNPSCTDFTISDTVALQEEIALCSEGLMEHFLADGALSSQQIRTAISRRQVFPCYFGAALRLEGVTNLLQGLSLYTEMPVCSEGFGARVFKISTDPQGNRLTHLKITGGNLQVRDVVTGIDRQQEPWSEKVNQLRIYSGDRFQTIENALPGTVCAVTGLSHTYPGAGLGEERDAALPSLQPVLTCRVDLPEGTDAHSALLKLRQLEDEDPQLHVVWNEHLQEIHIRLMGEIQLQILKSLIQQRFGMEVSFGQGNILYKETIAAPVEGVGHFEPLRHYAEVHLLLEPGKPGSGLVLSSACREDVLDRNWQRLILTHLAEKTHLGVLTGAPVTDLRITLLAGRAHLKHTEGGDFRQATYRAVRQGLKCAKSILLEPWYDFRLEVPTGSVGRAMSDLQRMCCTFQPPETVAGTSILTGSAPVAKLRDYQTEVAGYTHGRGRLSCSLRGYEPCHNTEEVVAAIGYDSDSDTENPTDSVFCAHGAGFTVKWDQVRDYMHVHTDFEEEAPEEELMPLQPAAPQPRTASQRAADYCSMVAQDKELMAIFERTYGPIRTNHAAAFRPVQRENAVKKTSYRAQPQPTGPEYLLVDGYNIIFAWEKLKAIAQESVDTARHQLINILCNYQGFRQCELILVFDAYRVKGNPGSVERIHNINVVYTKEAETADMYIEKVTNQLGKQRKVRVATSDSLEQLIILGHGAQRISASAFLDEVTQAEEAIREYLGSTSV